MKHVMSCLFLYVGTALLALTSFGANAPDTSLLKRDGRLILVGDSITAMGSSSRDGYYHLLTNLFSTVYTGSKYEVIPLGFHGHTISSWQEMEKKSRTHSITTGKDINGTNWDLHTAFARPADAVAIFLGMNDILCPTVRDDEKSCDAWMENYRELIRSLRARVSPKTVVLCTITPLTADFTGPKNRVRSALNQRLRRLAVEENCVVAGTGEEIVRLMISARLYQPRFQAVPDFVHPNFSQGHIVLAHAIMRALQDESMERALYNRIQKSVSALAPLEMAVSYWFKPDRITQADDGLLTYRLAYTWHDDVTQNVERVPAVRVSVPDGWRVSVPVQYSAAGLFTLRGAPSARVTPITLSATVDGRTVRQVINVPAPWRVAGGFDNEKSWNGTTWIHTNDLLQTEAALARGEGFDKPVVVNGVAYPWQLATATMDYTAFDFPDAIDPYSFTFGYKQDTIYAARWIYSEKARNVRVVLSHRTFSASLGLHVWMNGVLSVNETMDRSGKNRATGEVALKQGWNELFVRCDHSCWQRQFACTLEPLPGDSLDALRYAWTPQK